MSGCLAGINRESVTGSRLDAEKSLSQECEPRYVLIIHFLTGEAVDGDEGQMESRQLGERSDDCHR